MRLLKAVAVAVFGLIWAPAAIADPHASGDCGNGWLDCEVRDDAAYVGLLSREEVLALPAYPGDKGAPRPEGSGAVRWKVCPSRPSAWTNSVSASTT